FLGVVLQRLDSNTAEAFGLTKAEGALIADISKDGPADKAGLRPGDIIIKMNGKTIDNNSTLRNMLSYMHPGDVATLTILREDKELQFNVTVGAHPENELSAAEVQNTIGLMVQDTTPELLQQLGYNSDDKGVVIKAVAPNSPAHLASLRRGQLILSV